MRRRTISIFSALILGFSWGALRPSVEAPIGDFFGIGHGLNRNLSSLAIANSSEGRARNCYWYMPFHSSARITATNEGSREVGAFYYYIDFRLLSELEADVPYFHAQYRQEMPCAPGQNYPGKGGKQVKWQRAGSRTSGFVPLQSLFQPSEQAIVYGLAYVYAPEERSTYLLIGSDDGVRFWLNGELKHSNPAYRGAYPDQDRIPVRLRKGWNSVLIKVLQGTGGWGYYVRFADPDKTLIYSAENNQK